MIARLNKCRRLQFHLRSLLLLFLVTGVWLGIEVWCADGQQQRIAALGRLGGQVETERSHASPLNWVEPQRFGQRVVEVEVPASAIDEALTHLRHFSTLRRVRVAFDGSCELGGCWRRLTDALDQAVEVMPLPRPYDESIHQRRAERFLRKAHTGNADWRLILLELQTLAEGGFVFGTDDFYQPVKLANGDIAELLLIDRYQFPFQAHIALLLVRDECAGAILLEGNDVATAVKDVDLDGQAELVFEFVNPASWHQPRQPQSLPGDPRLWLGVYAITPAGFRSRLPQDYSALASSPHRAD
jgi:hypothetical protein